MADQVPRKTPLVTAVIVNYRTPELVRSCLDALRNQRVDVPTLRIIVVDGGSGDGSTAYLTALAQEAEFADWVTFMPLGLNGGFGWANNEGFRLARARQGWPDYFFVINPDATVRGGALGSLVRFLEQMPAAAVAGSRLHDTYGRVAGSKFDFPTVASEFARGLNAPRLTAWLVSAESDHAAAAPLECDWVSGASFLVRAAAIEACGGFDEGFFLYFEEVEFMSRLRKQGWEIWHVPQSAVDHFGGASTGVVDGASAARRLPAYWHEARWRYFSLRYSRLYAFAASVAWAVGRAGSAVRNAIGGGRKHMHAPHEFGDMVSFLLRGRPASPPAVGFLEHQPGQPPAWMART